MNIFLSIFLSIISGSITALAFPKYYLPLAAWIGLIPLFYAVYKAQNNKIAGLLGFVWGISFFGINLYWINILSLYVGSYASLGWISLIIFESLFIAVYTYIIKKFNLTLSYWAAVLWSSMEILRSTGPFGISGGILAYSQAPFLHFIQIVSVISIYGLSFIIILFNIGITNLLLNKNKTILITSIIFSIISLTYGFSELGLKNISNNEIKIATIQGNIPQEKKLDPTFNKEIFDTYKKLSLQATAKKPKIIVWPETTVLTYLLHDEESLKGIKHLAKKTNAYIFIGSPNYEEPDKIYNSVIVFSPSGEVLGRYDKQHLVPFGEYLPFRPLSYLILKGSNYFKTDFSPGNRFSPINIGNIKVGIVICFESTFPKIIKKSVDSGADIIIIATNDAWFKETAAPYEHLDNAIFRAIENRKYIIQAANTGFSFVIDPYGRILKKLDLNTQGILTFNLKLLKN